MRAVYSLPRVPFYIPVVVAVTLPWLAPCRGCAFEGVRNAGEGAKPMFDGKRGQERDSGSTLFSVLFIQ